MNKQDSINQLLNFTTCKSEKQLQFLAFSKHKIYNEYKIPKKLGKTRVLHEPTYKLKYIQHKILSKILEPHWKKKVGKDIKGVCFGFVKNKSILDNAKKHIGKQLVINIDISNFFPSISQRRVYGMFRKRFGYSHTGASYFSGLCTYQNELPQGAPTSPMIANIIAINLDKRIIKYIRVINKKEKTNITYTRYADDITISLDTDNPYLVENLCNRIFNIIEDENFLPNYTKFRTQKYNRKQEVTGIIVNDKISLGRKKFKELKAIVYNINNNGWRKEYQKYKQWYGKDCKSLKHFQNIIRGNISYYTMVNKETYSKHLILKR